MNEGRIDNLIMRVFLETTESIIGPNGMKSVLNYGGLREYIDAYPPDDDVKDIPVDHLRCLYQSLHEMFGDNGARTLMLRVGRENVRRGLEKRPAIAKAMRVAGHLVPETMKMKLALERLSEYIQGASSNDADTPPIEIREEKDYFYLIQQDNLESEGITSQQPVCCVERGIIEALMEWITGHPHEVEEVECRAMGNAVDVFRVSKAPSKQS